MFLIIILHDYYLKNIRYYLLVMDRVINLELDDPYSYKQVFKESYRDLTLVDIIFEILGSVQKQEDIKLKININITKDNIFISHTGSPLDQSDTERLLKIATHKLKENKKGVSKQGVGWRAIATVSSNRSFEKHNYDESDFYKYSSMISRIRSNIKIEDDKLKNNDVISLIHDDNFQIILKKGKFYKDIYDTYLKKQPGVLFIIPTNIHFYHNIDYEVIHKLKILFNRLDCQIEYKNELTDIHKDIFKYKPFYYIDKRITSNKYLEINCEMYTCVNKKILKMNILHQNNIVDLDSTKSHYFWMETYNNQKEVSEKYEYEDWTTDIDHEKLIPDNYCFRVRMMGFDPDNHQTNDDFKKWWLFYSGWEDQRNKNVKLDSYGDGIIPYIDDYCLKYANCASNKGYLRNKDYNAGKSLLRNGGDGGISGNNIPWKRTVGDKIITYKPKQNFLCELIEKRENINNERTMLSLNPIKSQSNVCDNDGYAKTVPFFLLWLSHKYIWSISEEDIDEISLEEKLEKQKEKTEKEKQEKNNALKKLRKEEKEKAAAQQKAKEEEIKKNKQIEKKKLAEQKAEKAHQAKLLAQKKAEKEETEKLIAMQKAEKEEEEKIIAIQKAEKEEEDKLLAQQIAEEEKVKKETSMKTTQRVAELLQEVNEQKEELEKEIEDEEKYIPIEDEKNIKSGHCYSLKDPTRKKYRKIGKSSKEECKLNKQYIPRYMPLGITMKQWVPFNNSKLAEDHIFEKLKKYRIAGTEWFEFPEMDESEIDTFIENIFANYKTFIEE